MWSSWLFVKDAHIFFYYAQLCFYGLASLCQQNPPKPIQLMFACQSGVATPLSVYVRGVATPDYIYTRMRNYAKSTHPLSCPSFSPFYRPIRTASVPSILSAGRDIYDMSQSIRTFLLFSFLKEEEEEYEDTKIMKSRMSEFSRGRLHSGELCVGVCFRYFFNYYYYY